MRHGPLGLREVLARVRHDLRGRAAALRRVALRVRAPVPADDGEAGRGLDRRALARDLDRPEDDFAQPALDGRHGHRDLRLPAAPVRADRSAALPDLRAAHHRPVPRPDRGAGAAPAGGNEVHRQRARRPRPQGRVQGRARGAPAGRVHQGEGGRRAATARGGDRARQEVQAHDRGGRRPARDEARPAAAADAVHRDRDVARRRTGRRRRDRRRASDLLGEPGVPGARRLPARSSSRARFPSTRRMARAPGARGSGRSSRSTPICSCPTARSRSTRARSCRGRSAARASTTASSRRSPSATRSRSTFPGASWSGSSRTGSCTGRTATRSSSRTATAWVAGASTRWRSRGWSTTSSGATGRPTPRSSGTGSRST